MGHPVRSVRWTGFCVESVARVLGALKRLGEGLETGLPVGADLSCPSVPNGFQRILPLGPLSSQFGNVSTDLRSGSASILEAL